MASQSCSSSGDSSCRGTSGSYPEVVHRVIHRIIHKWWKTAPIRGQWVDQKNRTWHPWLPFRNIIYIIGR